MSDLTVVATFTKSGGDPATGEALGDFDFYLTRQNISTGIDTVVWDGTQNATQEVDNAGKYTRILAGADFTTYHYHAAIEYTGGTGMDSSWSIGSAGAPQSEAIAVGVWSEALPGAYAIGTAGANLSPSITVAIATVIAAIAALNDPTAAVIADAVWDEMIAAHLLAGSTGEALNDAGGATIFPAGAIPYTYIVTNDVTLLPIEGVEVWISTDDPAVNIVWKGDTDTFGIARDVNNELPNLDAGIYNFWRQRSGYTFVDPDVETVS